MNPKKDKSFSGELPGVLNTEKGTPCQAGMGKEGQLAQKGCSWALCQGLSRESWHGKNELVAGRVSMTKYLNQQVREERTYFELTVSEISVHSPQSR